MNEDNYNNSESIIHQPRKIESESESGSDSEALERKLYKEEIQAQNIKVEKNDDE